ncbi:unnamed protein product [Danaus chrysippus]|uniref:(African queen) hypothetical protein n=1 Tax=Danaus chrysippus TaxID=151541 RepID=A0A8J2R7P1_9NEOP|nr:unnamed protein product [Danaus chrysippus]
MYGVQVKNLKQVVLEAKMITVDGRVIPYSIKKLKIKKKSSLKKLPISIVMEQPEVEKGCGSSEYGAQLTRNRSFKSKQLVRSQAIRESTSPPRTVSPLTNETHVNNENTLEKTSNSENSSHTDGCTVISSDNKQPVEIQITSNSWEEGASDQRQRTRRWLGHRHHSDSTRDLLTHGPRVACVCGACECPHCRGRRRRHACPTKQDSGIVCSDDCPDCTDSEHAGPNGDGARMSGSLDSDDQAYYCRCIDRKDKPKSISIGGNEFEDKTDLSGPELVAFIKETLNKNPRDRATLLRIEKELHGLVTDNSALPSRCIVRFPVMTSYGRMLVHRCAALFQLAHHLDHSNKNSVLVSKSGTCGGRLPCTSFREWCTTVFPRSPTHEDTLAKSILKRCSGPPGTSNSAAGRSKSLEQRERDYERVRRRIFSTDNCTQDETQWPWLSSGPVKLLTPDTGRNKLLKVHSLESKSPGRGVVSKSHSFGGYTDPQQRVLSRQGDLASSSWRLSPSSSGYKTLSLRSTDSVTPSPTGGASPEPGPPSLCVPGASGALVWAVTDMAAVPPGALVIHPQTGRPLTNPDGSLYHFDPENPPLLYDNTHKQTDKIDVNTEKRRGKLEKQNSFIDNECEYDTNREKRCDCTQDNDKVQQKPKTPSIPPSPNKTRKTYEEQTTTPNTPEPNGNIQNEAVEIKQAFENIKITQKSPNKEKKDIQMETINQIQSRYESANQNASLPRFESPANNTPSVQRFESPANQTASNQSQRFETANQMQQIQRFDSPANHVQAIQRFDSPANNRQYDRYDVCNKSLENRNFDNQRKILEEVYHETYVPYKNEEAPQMMVNYQPEMTEMQVMQAKMTPVPVQDNMRGVAVPNHPGYYQPMQNYQYMPCRVEQPIQHLQPQMYQQMTEDQKQMTPSPHNENTFRIDPSYPYLTDFNNACGACDPAQARGYNVQYQPEPVMYPNMLMQPMQQYPYQEQMQVQWQNVAAVAPKVVMHDVYPIVYPSVYPNVYPPYNIVYPQVLPQYPMQQFQDRRKKRYERDTEIAMKIQQIKQQVDMMGGDRRRNSGGGILGNAPGRVGTRSDDNQLSSAARAIVNSIRNMQAKNQFHESRRSPPRPERPEQRRRTAGPVYRQMSPGAWCRSPAPMPQTFSQPRRPNPENRNARR